MFDTGDPITTSWLLAIALLFLVVVVVPIARMLIALAIYAYAAITGRRHLRTVAARVMPRLGHLLGSVVVGVASIAAPAAAAPQADQPTQISIDRITPVAEPAPEEVTATPVSDIYVVEVGDSLWDIAASQSPAATDAQITETWKAIWRANRHVIGDHPELIRPGMELVIEGTDQ